MNLPKDIDKMQNEVSAWGSNAVPNAEPLDQAGHVVNEASEVLDVYVKSKQYGYILSRSEVRDEIGDTVIALMNLAAMEHLSLYECVEAAMKDNLDPESDGGPPQ